jgi:hypothetical protein
MKVNYKTILFLTEAFALPQQPPTPDSYTHAAISARSFPAMKIPTHGALRFANGTLQRVNCFVKIS